MNYPTRKNILNMLDLRIELLRDGEPKKELEWARLIITEHFRNNPVEEKQRTYFYETLDELCTGCWTKQLVHITCDDQTMEATLCPICDEEMYNLYDNEKK